ncbi:MAG: hypothetical protein LBO64_09230 [Desulfovibrio sp.]|jgi:hypothetical protein|nr:hypothetical protein [Desulfovibrio sp.]
MRNYTKNISFFLVLLFVFMSFGCAHKDAPTVDQVTDQGNKLKALSRSRVIDVSDDSYLGARAMSSSDAALNLRVTLRRKGALSEIADSISEMTRVTVQVSATVPESLKPGDPDPPPGLPNTILAVSYEGPLRGLLDQLSVNRH